MASGGRKRLEAECMPAMEGQGQNDCQVDAQFTHSGFATPDLLLRQTVRKGSDFPSCIEFSRFSRYGCCLFWHFC